MTYEEMGNMDGKTLMLLPGTCCDWQTNFGSVIERLSEKYHLICVNYDGFDGGEDIFPDMITVTEKIEKYIIDKHHGRIDGAIGSSLGSSFVGQLIQRERVHLDHGIFGSPDLDQSGRLAAWLQSKLVVPLLTSFTKNEKKRKKTRDLLKNTFLMSDEVADKFMECFAKFSPQSIKNEYYTDLLTYLNEDIHVEHTRAHFIYANKMGEKYLKRYKKYFRDPDIREFDMQHEQWLLGEEKYTLPVLKVIDEFMEMPV
ncbi:2-hydroxy-6-oxo-6-phenylhexa-2,4-dienoate hydrolase [Butyrivibrio sp. FC2001]|uniref:2-hydroxy-6-oxo-6-phenylhexa-2,4-dienoate hydrolase n=1 Tax=Butyrivibrio sp. FC2001 TaxID=1280671 RepID=UPI00041EAD20|nr:2-hydroxy-6-oxo-6-phenylhexa-2,4-dienoate hydrolase [Butyrivibrio sp. FC2001]